MDLPPGEAATQRAQAQTGAAELAARDSASIAGIQEENYLPWVVKPYGKHGYGSKLFTPINGHL